MINHLAELLLGETASRTAAKFAYKALRKQLKASAKRIEEKTEIKRREIRELRLQQLSQHDLGQKK